MKMGIGTDSTASCIAVRVRAAVARYISKISFLTVRGCMSEILTESSATRMEVNVRNSGHSTILKGIKFLKISFTAFNW